MIGVTLTRYLAARFAKTKEQVAEMRPLRAKHSDQAPHLKAKFNTSSLSNQVTSPDYHVGIDNP